MIADPARRGQALAAVYLEVEPRLYLDLEESGLLPPAATRADAARRRGEWECFLLYACVRGLVAAGGFNRETARAIDALHDAALAAWGAEAGRAETLETRRARVSERYAEYGAIGQEGGAAGAATVTERLGAAAARHLGADPEPAVVTLVGGLHEVMAEGSAEAVRRAK